MKNLLLAAAILTTTRYAAAGGGAVETAAPEVAASFAAPIAQTMMAVGTEQIGALGQASLTNLSQLMLETPDAAAQTPEAFARLGKTLAARGMTAESFAALDSKQRAALLKEAAAEAEASAAAQAAAAIKLYSAERTPEKAKELLSAFDLLAAKSIDLYLAPETREALTMARKSLADIAERPARERRQFYAGLGEKLAHGSFDGSNTFVKTGQGWTFADYGPDSEVFPTLHEAVNARVDLAHKMPAGPWREELYSAVLKGLLRPDIQAQFQAEGVDDAAFVALDENVSKLRMTALADDPKLAKAVEEMRLSNATGKVPSISDIRTLSRHYDSAADRGFSRDVTSRWRIASWLLRGNPIRGYPSVDALSAMREAAAAREHRGALHAFVALIASFVLAVFGDIATGGWGATAMSVVAIGSVIYLEIRVWRRDSLTWSTMELSSAKSAADAFEEHALPNKSGTLRGRQRFS